MRKATPIEDRLRAGMEIDDAGCWLWIKFIDPSGYGRIFTGTRGAGNRRPSLAYRLSYETFVGPVPDGLVLDHLCRVRHCINPQHLEPVTFRENVLRGIAPPALNAVKTHCPHGHDYTPENTLRDRHGKRYCIECRHVYAATKAARRLAS